MNEVARQAAHAWAQAHAVRIADPVEFGAKVAQVFMAARAVEHHGGDTRATAAALAVLSIPSEKLQLLEQLSELLARFAAGTSQPDRLGG